MHTQNEIIIHGSADRIFALGANIGDWPKILPHYRWVKVFSDDGLVKQAEMAARRNSFPVKWQTSQIVLPDQRRLIFFHTGGVSRGMYVEWILTPLPQAEGGGVRVVIFHDLTYPVAFATNWFAHSIVGEMFVSYIASKTLARIKEIVEQEQREFEKEGRAA